jgi:dipeptide/tripeptide permease
MSDRAHTPQDEPTLVVRDEATVPPPDETTLADVKQLTLWPAIRSLNYVFWIVGAMEMIERLAYYGVRAVATLYATLSVKEGGLGVTMATYGWLMMFWNFTQNIIAIFTGGLSDRYGYKQTIFASTIVKASGYLVMALFYSWTGFFVGAMLLAAGTAIFKPGVQGTLIRTTNRRNSSIAWGIFYQTVNIGGWIGPLIALYNREHISWPAVFYTNAAVICCNFLLLLTYREPGKEERLARQQRIREGKAKQSNLALATLGELRKPHLSIYLLIFALWWFMFPMLWDVLPRHVADWVDTTPIVKFLFGADGTQNKYWKFIFGMDASGKFIKPEGIVNINAGMIMITCFLVAGLGAKLRANTSLVLGTVLIVSGLALFGATNFIGFGVLALILFSLGEMLASPKYLEFLGNIAPPDKKAMWMGFSQAPITLGWTIEGKLGPQLYYWLSSKDEFARQMLVERGMSPAAVTHDALPIGDAFKKLVEFTGDTPEHLTQLLFQAHHVGMTWYIFAAIGVASAVMIYFYGQWILKLAGKR